MSLGKLGVFASLALAAGAVLIPPNIAAVDLGSPAAFDALAINPARRSFALECPGCAVATREGQSLSWSEDQGNAFLLDFEVGPHDDTLDIDGVQLYPPSFEFAAQPFHVTQLNPDGGDGLNLRVTGYTFHFNSAETISEAGVELLPMTFQITSIESNPFDLPAVTINLLKDTNGRLMIASFRTADAVKINAIDQEDCKQWPLMCEWKSIVAERIEKLKSMGKGMGCHKGHKNPMQLDTSEGKPPHMFRPGHPHRPHHVDHSGHGHHNFHMAIRRAFFTIIIPIVIGIMAGMLTYLVGMALGCLIAIVIAKARGQDYEVLLSRADAPTEVYEDVEACKMSSEKQEYAELPAYEAPPVYNDAVEAENVEPADKAVDESK